MGRPLLNGPQEEQEKKRLEEEKLLRAREEARRKEIEERQEKESRIQQAKQTQIQREQEEERRRRVCLPFPHLSNLTRNNQRHCKEISRKRGEELCNSGPTSYRKNWSWTSYGERYYILSSKLTK